MVGKKTGRREQKTDSLYLLEGAELHQCAGESAVVRDVDVEQLRRLKETRVVATVTHNLNLSAVGTSDELLQKTEEVRTLIWLTFLSLYLSLGLEKLFCSSLLIPLLLLVALLFTLLCSSRSLPRAQRAC